MTDPEEELDPEEVILEAERMALDRLQPDGDPVYTATSRALAGKGAAVQLALAMLERAMKEHSWFLARATSRGVLSAVICPDAEWAPEIATALRSMIDALSLDRAALTTTGPSTPKRRRGTPEPVPSDRFDDGPVVLELNSTRSSEVRDLRSTIASGQAALVVLRDRDAVLPSEVRLAVAETLVIQPPDAWTMRNFAFSTARNHAEQGQYAQPQLLPRRLPHGLLGRIELLTPFLTDLACGSARGARNMLFSLDRVLRERKAQLEKMPAPGVTLDTLHGIGEAGVWGQRLVADLVLYKDGRLPWSEVDRGIVLVGDPGVGKTSFARALANTARIPLVVSSLTEWQGTRAGHLGDLLSAMRASFNQARKSAPCIMLIDEIDSFPARASVRHDRRDYVIQVINGLLAELDGALPREGVVVIGACNDASDLDPALVRAGRLERVVRIPRPDAAALVLILRTHLGSSLADADLSAIAQSAAERGAVGADVERWCRGARRRSRVAGREMVLDDLVQEVGPGRTPDDEATRRRICVHEAGHALAWAEMGKGILLGVRIGRRGDRSAYNEVDISDLLRTSITRGEATQHILALLAGRAAEEELLGAPSGGAGGSPHSDLGTATRLALLLVTSLGLDDHPHGLLYRGGADHAEITDVLTQDPDLRERVAAILRECHEEARVLVRRRRDAIDRLALRLEEQTSLDADEVMDIIGVGEADIPTSESGPPPMSPLDAPPPSIGARPGG